jgi:hypothetical protein
MIFLASAMIFRICINIFLIVANGRVVQMKEDKIAAWCVFLTLYYCLLEVLPGLVILSVIQLSSTRFEVDSQVMTDSDDENPLRYMNESLQ